MNLYQVGVATSAARSISMPMAPLTDAFSLVKLLLQGLTSKEIAVKMSISPNTVKAFLKLAMAKVGASNRTALIARLFDMASLVALTVRPDDFGLF